MKSGLNVLGVTALVASLLATSAAQAMEIRQFDKMAVPDQGDYVGLLIGGAEQVLNDEGRSDLEAKVDHLFTTTEPGDRATIGIVEFVRNLARARLADDERALKDPNARRLRVEDAMGVTLKKNGIDLPQAFFTVGNNFRPKLPPATAPAPPPRAAPPAASSPKPFDDDPIGPGGFITPPPK